MTNQDEFPLDCTDRFALINVLRELADKLESEELIHRSGRLVIKARLVMPSPKEPTLPGLSIESNMVFTVAGCD